MSSPYVGVSFILDATHAETAVPASLVQYVPAWFPGTAWKQKAKLYRQYVEGMLQEPFELVKQQLVCEHWLIGLGSY